MRPWQTTGCWSVNENLHRLLKDNINHELQLVKKKMADGKLNILPN